MGALGGVGLLHQGRVLAGALEPGPSAPFGLVEGRRCARSPLHRELQGVDGHPEGSHGGGRRLDALPGLLDGVAPPGRAPRGHPRTERALCARVERGHGRVVLGLSGGEPLDRQGRLPTPLPPGLDLAGVVQRGGGQGVGGLRALDRREPLHRGGLERCPHGVECRGRSSSGNADQSGAAAGPPSPESLAPSAPGSPSASATRPAGASARTSASTARSERRAACSDSQASSPTRLRRVANHSSTRGIGADVEQPLEQAASLLGRGPQERREVALGEQHHLAELLQPHAEDVLDDVGDLVVTGAEGVPASRPGAPTATAFAGTLVSPVPRDLGRMNSGERSSRNRRPPAVSSRVTWGTAPALGVVAVQALLRAGAGHVGIQGEGDRVEQARLAGPGGARG